MTPKSIEPHQPAVTETWLARTYQHAECGHETLVSGHDYVQLESPFRPIESTLCSGCGRLVPLTSLAWSDSGENVAAYRQRLYQSVSFWRKIYLMLLGNAYEGAVALNLDSKGHPKSAERQVAG